MAEDNQGLFTRVDKVPQPQQTYAERMMSQNVNAGAQRVGQEPQQGATPGVNSTEPTRTR